MSSPDRARLADLLLAAGAQAPTLCEGWRARDLAAHLVVRDGRPDAAASLLAGQVAGALPDRVTGSVGPRLARHGEQVLAGTAAQPFEDLVRRFRAGPPRWSPTALPAVERAVNAVEFFVHAEDVHRAAPGWEPFPLRPGQREALWKALRRQARLLYRHSPVGVVLSVPAGPRTVAVRRPDPVEVTGQPEELLLHAFGRRSVARVEVSGPAGSGEALAAVPLGF